MPRYVPEDSLLSPRFTGPTTFARLPHVRTLEEVDVAIVGVPFDTGVTYRVGGRFGPSAVRTASVMLRPYNANLDVAPFEVLSCVDYGDVAIVPGYTERSYAAIEAAIEPIVEAGGPSARDMLAILRRLTGIDFVGFDVVEVIPAYDPAGQTATLAANLAYEMLSLVALRRRDG